MKQLYIDIDGVLLRSSHSIAAPGAVELIDLAVNHFDCYWLTSYGKDGDPRFALRLLARYFDAATMEKLKRIKPTTWRRLKTEGIDLDSDFVWLDDLSLRSQGKREGVEGHFHAFQAQRKNTLSYHTYT